MLRSIVGIISCLTTIMSISQQYSFIQYSRPEGLPQTQISSIVQDSKGYLWIGTVGGLSRFNGIEFSNSSKSEGLLDNQVNCLFVDSANNVWVGNNGGISLVNQNKISGYPFKKELDKVSIRCLHVHGEKLYMGSRSDGLFYCSQRGIQDTIHDVFRMGDPSMKIRAFVQYGSDLLIGSDHGLKKLQGDSLVSVAKEFDKLNVSGLACQNGHLWVSTLQNGVFHHFDGKTTTYNQGNGGIRTNRTRSIIIDENGEPWVGTRTGLEHLQGNRFISFTSKNGLINDNIKVVFEDMEGNVWIGSDGAGVFKFSGYRFIGLTEKDGMTNDLVMSFTEDSSGLWIATYGGGISYFTDGQFINYSEKEMLSNPLIWCSATDNENRVWFGTSSGITIKDKTGVHPFHIDETIDHVRVTSLKTHQGKMFIGHRNGLSVYSGDSIVHLDVGFKRVRDLQSTKDGILLVGSSNGIYKFHQDVFTRVSVKNDEELYPAYSIAAMDSNRFWIGNPNGLFMVTNDTATKIKLGPASGHNFINFLLLENEDVLWAGTNHGLYEINVSSLNKNGVLVARNYTPSDGTRSYETNLNAAYKSSAGTIWFGTINGALMFAGERFDRDHQPEVPVLNISEIQLSLDKTNWDKFCRGYLKGTNLPMNLSLPFQKNHLTFHFIGISHSFPKQVKYQTMLNGFDEDWNPVSQTRFITYSNLQSGEYTFRVRASIDEKSWTKEQTFSFVIKPPFWKTIWFISLVSLLGLTGIYIIFKVRMRSLEARRTTENLIYKTRLMNLEQQSLNASMNRHFIFNALNSIQYYINRQDKLAANRYLSSFAKLIRKNLDSSNSTDNLVLLTEELERLDLYISLEHIRFQDEFDYEISIAPDLDTDSIRVPAMFLQPYVENSIWHGVLPMQKPGKIRVDIVKTDNQIKFVIEDNGIGIDESLKRKKSKEISHDSKGMLITSSRINVLRKITKRNIQIVGPFELQDEQGNGIGTKVEIMFPLEKNTTFSEKSR